MMRQKTRMPRYPCPLRQAALACPDGVAVCLDGGAVTFAELDRRVCTAVADLFDAGMEKGQKLALVSETCLESIILMLAAIRLGILVCPLSYRFPPRQLMALLSELAIDRVWCPIDRLKPACRAVPLFGLQEGSQKDESAALQPIELPAEQLCSMILTSGSSGRPKAVVHSLANHLFSANGSNQRIPLQSGDAWLLSLPLFHIGGLAIVFRTLLAQAAMVIGTAQRPLHEILLRQPVTHISLVNAQVYRLLKESPIRPGDTRLKVLLLGGGYIADDLLQTLGNTKVSVYLTYGLTEMASQVTTGKVKLGEGGFTAGKVLPYRELSIAADGEILVRGETLFKGYYSHNGLCLELDRDGWFHTRDRGRFVGARLEVLGRLDNQFISGGENIQPEEIEHLLLAFPEITQAVVVPVPDPEFGRRPVAFIQRTAAVSDAEIRRRLSRRIPRFKIPDRFLEWLAEPAEAGFKINRKTLAAHACRLL